MSVAPDRLEPVRIVFVGNRPRAAWAEGLRIQLPASLLERAGWRPLLTPRGELAIPPNPSCITADDVTRLREHRAFTDVRPASARLPVSYRIVPGWARASIATAIGRWQRRHVDRWGAFPAWPIDVSADVLDDLRDGGSPLSPPGRTPVVLTHDIDSPEGLTNLMADFLPLEEALGARSTSYIVPCAWRVDHARVGELAARGHGIGVHGYDHSHTTPFADAKTRARRLDGARGFAEQYGAAGYRAPSLLRTRGLLRDLAPRFRYDSSIPTSGGPFPTPNNGCATTRPFVVEQITELPITLPRDGSMRFLGYRPAEIASTWIECAELVARARGVVVLVTHCERRFSGGPAMLDAYRGFLEYVKERQDRFAFSTALDETAKC